LKQNGAAKRVLLSLALSLGGEHILHPTLLSLSPHRRPSRAADAAIFPSGICNRDPSSSSVRKRFAGPAQSSALPRGARGSSSMKPRHRRSSPAGDAGVSSLWIPGPRKVPQNQIPTKTRDNRQPALAREPPPGKRPLLRCSSWVAPRRPQFPCVEHREHSTGGAPGTMTRRLTSVPSVYRFALHCGRAP
jgi:hypothetical protein